MIIAVLGEKGGTGKTTLATNLAGLRATAGQQVLLVDADRQGSASYWAEHRRPPALRSPVSKNLGGPWGATSGPWPRGMTTSLSTWRPVTVPTWRPSYGWPRAS